MVLILLSGVPKTKNSLHRRVDEFLEVKQLVSVGTVKTPIKRAKTSGHVFQNKTKLFVFFFLDLK